MTDRDSFIAWFQTLDMEQRKLVWYACECMTREEVEVQTYTSREAAQFRDQATRLAERLREVEAERDRARAEIGRICRLFNYRPGLDDASPSSQPTAQGREEPDLGPGCPECGCYAGDHVNCSLSPAARRVPPSGKGSEALRGAPPEPEQPAEVKGWVPSKGEVIRRKYDGTLVKTLQYTPTGYVRYERPDGHLGSDHIRSVEPAPPPIPTPPLLTAEQLREDLVGALRRVAAGRRPDYTPALMGLLADELEKARKA